MKNSPKLLLDSNVITDGLFSRFGLSKSVLALCAAKTCKLVLSEWVRIEVERNILKQLGNLPENEVEELIEDYQGFLKLARPVKIPLAEESHVVANRSLIRHFADVPVVLAAIDGQVDWLITRNRDHFTDEVSRKIRIRIASPGEFFSALIESFEKSL
jgi:predicted nucleic acid-binding protein